MAKKTATENDNLGTPGQPNPTPETQLPATVPPPETELRRLDAMNALTFDGPRWVGNFKPKSRVGKILLILAANSPTKKARELGEKNFALKYWMAERVTNPFAQEGQPEEAVKLTLISDTHDTLITSSRAIIRVLDAVRKAFGDGPYDPAIPLRFTLISTSAGRVSYRVAVDYESNPALLAEVEEVQKSA